RWIVLAGVLIGFGFLTKQLQVFLIIPALVAVYAACAPVGWWARIRRLLAAAAAIIVSDGSWVAAVRPTRPSDRPYTGGGPRQSAGGRAAGTCWPPRQRSSYPPGGGSLLSGSPGRRTGRTSAGRSIIRFSS